MEFKQENFKVTKTEGTATVTYDDKKAFVEGTDISEKDLKAAFKYANEYIEAATTAGAKTAETIMSKDKKIDNVVISVPYGMSARGEIGIKAKRSHTYPGMNGNADVTKSTLAVAVKDPLTKMGKTKLKSLEADMTAALLS